MSEKRDQILIEESHPGKRLDTFLREQYQTVSRGTIQRLIENGYVTVNDKPVKANHRPREGETVEIVWPKARPAQIKPVDIPLDILFEDSDLLVVDKPPDLVVHPAAGNEERTLVNALLHHCRGQLSGIGGVERPGIVHRLDKDTTGCIVVAKNDETHLGLSQQFADRTTEKIYLALVYGAVQEPEGEIRAAIARHPNHRKVMTVTWGGGKEAWTSFRITDRLQDATLLEATLHTGRTHQVRVHFKHIGHPLVGDTTYSKRQIPRHKELTGYHPPRVMLHAYRLGFIHPRTKETIKIVAPIPEDFQAALEALKFKDED